MMNNNDTNAQPQNYSANTNHNTSQADYKAIHDPGLEDEDKVIKNGELANNDGSIVETLDTAFHDKPGMINTHSIAGSNRAEYYEARSDGKSDSEEELEYIKQQKQSNT